MTFQDDDRFSNGKAAARFEVKRTAVEFKFVSDSQPGVFEGYGSVFNNVDSYGDMVMPGAYTATLAEHKAAGTMPGLYAEHSPYMGGDPLPIGIWTDITQDNQGLRVKGKLSALDTDHGRRIRSLMLDGGLKGLSIAFQVRPGGAVPTGNKKKGEPLRLLKAVNLASIDIVRDPSNTAATIDQIKSANMTFASASELEDFLHDNGISNRASKLIAGAGYAALMKSAIPEIDVDQVAAVLRSLGRELKRS